MRKQKIYRIQFLQPGSFVANERWELFTTKPDPRSVHFTERDYAFQIFEREDVIDDAGGTFKGKESALGPVYYHPDSKLETLDEIKARNDPRDKILISNCVTNGWSTLILTRWGHWPQPYDPNTHAIL